MIDNWVFLYKNVTQSGPMSIKKSIQLTILLKFKTKLMSMKKKNIHYDFKVKNNNKWRVLVSNKCGTQLKFIC
jgi:hypothetical protein